MTARPLLRLAAALLAALLTACAGAPERSLAWREAWDLVAFGDDGVLIDARLERGNTGLLRGQGQLSMVVFPPHDSPVILRRTAAPGTVAFSAEAGDLRVAQDRLERRAGAWMLQVREGAEFLDAALQLVPEVAELPPATLVEGRRQWLVGAPVPAGSVAGAWRAGEAGGLLRGRGMLVRQSSDTWPGRAHPEGALTLANPRCLLAVRRVGDAALAWLYADGELRWARSVSIRRTGHRIELSLEPELAVTASVELARRRVLLEAWSQLIALERPLARLAFGTPDRAFERGTAELVVDGARERSTALLVGRELPQVPHRERRAAR